MKPSYEELETRINELEGLRLEYEKLLMEFNRQIKSSHQNFIVSDRKYKALFNSSADAICVLDLETERFVDCNEAALNLYGIKTQEIFLKLTPSCLSPEYQPNGRPSKELSIEYIQEAFNSGGKMFEWVHCKIDGTPVYVIVTLSPLTIGDKKLVLAVIKDITTRKKAEEAREMLFRSLQGALDKVKTLSGLLPICSRCKKIRDDKGYWKQIEAHIQDHTYVKFSHGICPQCAETIYGNEDWYIQMKRDKSND